MRWLTLCPIRSCPSPSPVVQLTCVNLIDSHHCSDPSKFLSVLLISLCTMGQLELPHVNILSKMDLIEMYGELEFGLEFYTDVLDLSYLLPRLKSTSNPNHPLTKKFAKLNAAIADLVEMYNLVSFVPLDIQNQEMIINAVKLADKANGFLYVQDKSSTTGKGAAESTTAGQEAVIKAQAEEHNQRLMTMAHKTGNEELRMLVASGVTWATGGGAWQACIGCHRMWVLLSDGRRRSQLLRRTLLSPLAVPTSRSDTSRAPRSNRHSSTSHDSCRRLRR